MRSFFSIRLVIAALLVSFVQTAWASPLQVEVLQAAHESDPSGLKTIQILQSLYSQSEFDSEAAETLIDAFRNHSEWIPWNAANFLFKHMLNPRFRGPAWPVRLRVIVAMLRDSYLTVFILQSHCEDIINGQPLPGVEYERESLNAALQDALWNELITLRDETSKTVINLLNRSLKSTPRLRERHLYQLIEKTPSEDLVDILPPLFDAIRDTGTFETLALRSLTKKLQALLKQHNIGAELDVSAGGLLLRGTQLLAQRYASHGLAHEFLSTIASSTFITSEEYRRHLKRELASVLPVPEECVAALTVPFPLPRSLKN